MVRIRSLLCALLLATACGAAPTGISTPTTPTPPTPGPAGPAVCGTLSNAGAYTMSADIGFGSKQLCLTISTSNVTLDCAHHTINGFVQIGDNMANVAIQNCVMAGMFILKGVSNVTISNSTILASEIFGTIGASNVIVSNSTMSSPVFVVSSHNVALNHNQIAMTGGRPSAVAYFQNGGQNQVIGNVLDGFYTGHDLTGEGLDAPGADDGVVLDNEVGDTVRDNTIQHVFDAGIEGVDTVSAATIANNEVTHAILDGIGSYWCTHWENNTISGNRVSDSQAAVNIVFQVGSLCNQVPMPSGQFSGNTIAGNSLRNPLGPSPAGISVSLGQLGSSVSLNSVIGNDVGTAPIILLPGAGFAVGAGNVCGPGGSGSIAC